MNTTLSPTKTQLQAATHARERLPAGHGQTNFVTHPVGAVKRLTSPCRGGVTYCRNFLYLNRGGASGSIPSRSHRCCS
jgi:hypothetical protein